MSKQCLVIPILFLVLVTSFVTGCTQNAPETLSPVIFQPQPKINQTRAIAIASHYVPVEALVRSDIIPNLLSASTGKGEIWTWSVIYHNANVTREQLEASGWQAGTDTDFASLSPYSSVTITIDANTGELLHKTASYGIYLGGPPSSNIRVDEAEIIASRYIPAKIAARARIESISTLKPSWLIYYIVDVTQSELGWHASKDTHLNNLKSEEKYFELVIEIDMTTGNFIQRAAFTLSQATPSPSTQTFSTLTVTQISPTSVISLMLAENK